MVDITVRVRQKLMLNARKEQSGDGQMTTVRWGVNNPAVEVNGSEMRPQSQQSEITIGSVKILYSKCGQRYERKL